MKQNWFISRSVAASLALTISAGSAAAVEATATNAVNVRTGPGASYAKVDTLFAGEVVEITECQSGWCFVQHPGPDGWVSGSYLAATGSPGSGSSAAGDAAAAIIFGTILGAILNNNPPPAPPPAPAPALPYGPDTCKPGFVWRDAIPGDHVCVAPARRTAAANENAVAGSRVDPTGPYGPNSCKSGFVWREAYAGDVVCVTPARRTEVHQENLDGPSHRVLP